MNSDERENRIKNTFAEVTSFLWGNEPRDNQPLSLTDLLYFIVGESRRRPNKDLIDQIQNDPKGFKIKHVLDENNHFSPESFASGLEKELLSNEAKLLGLEKKMELLEENYRRLLREQKLKQDYYTYTEEGVMHGSRVYLEVKQLIEQKCLGSGKLFLQVSSGQVSLRTKSFFARQHGNKENVRAPPSLPREFSKSIAIKGGMFSFPIISGKEPLEICLMAKATRKILASTKIQIDSIKDQRIHKRLYALRESTFNSTATACFALIRSLYIYNQSSFDEQNHKRQEETYRKIREVTRTETEAVKARLRNLRSREGIRLLDTMELLQKADSELDVKREETTNMLLSPKCLKQCLELQAQAQAQEEVISLNESIYDPQRQIELFMHGKDEETFEFYEKQQELTILAADDQSTELSRDLSPELKALEKSNSSNNSRSILGLITNDPPVLAKELKHKRHVKSELDLPPLPVKPKQSACTNKRKPATKAPRSLSGVSMTPLENVEKGPPSTKHFINSPQNINFSHFDNMSNIYVLGSERSLNTSGRVQSDTDTVKNFVCLFGAEFPSLKLIDGPGDNNDIFAKCDEFSVCDNLSILEDPFNKKEERLREEEEVLSFPKPSRAEGQPDVKNLPAKERNFCLGAFLLLRKTLS